MKKNIKKIIFSDYFPFIILFILMFIIHIFINIKTNDYLWFKYMSDRMNINDFLVGRYNDWTSRIIIELILMSLIKLPIWIFKILDIIIITLVGVVISYLFVNKNKKENNYLIISLILLYQLLDMSSAGWYATMINYMWPLLFMLISFIPIKNYLINKNDKWYMKLVYIISLLIACNQEQTSCIVFGVYLLFLIYMIYKKKISLFNVLLFVLSIISLLFILTCPGNDSRSIAEANNYYPSFGNYNIIQKSLLGLNSMISIFITSNNLLFIILCVFICILCFKHENRIIKYISIIPIVIVSILNYFKNISFDLFPFISKFSNLFFNQNIVHNIENENLLMYLTAFIGIMIFSLTIYSIYIIFRNEKKVENKFFPALVLIIGLASRLIIGLSPTVFASGGRTALFLNFSMIVTVLLLWQKYIDIGNFKSRKRFLLLIFIFGILQYSNILLKIIN